MFLMNIMVFLPVVLVALYFIMSRSKYKNISKGGPFFFENGCLVLNTGVPQPIPMLDIEYVELQYNLWELENRLSYGLECKVVEKNGKSRKVFHKGNRYASYGLPSDMAVSLEERGIRCVIMEK